MQGFDQKSYKNLKIQFDGFTRGLSWKGAYEGIRGQDRIGIWGHKERGVDMGTGDGGVERWYRLPLTARDPSIYGQDLNSISFGLPGSGNPAEWYFQSGHSYTPGGGLKTPYHWTHTSCIWCCNYWYESLTSSKWIGNHGYETLLSSMIRGIIVSSWIILWPLFQCCTGLPQTYYLSLSFKPCYFLLRSGTMDY